VIRSALVISGDAEQEKAGPENAGREAESGCRRNPSWSQSAQNSKASNCKAKVLQAAIIGMGGFAQNHHWAMHALEKSHEVALQATCDPRPEPLTPQQEKWDLSGRGVSIYTDYLEMLDAHREELDFVTVPTPLPLHALMHRACVERGLACYLEKPPTLNWRELEAMIEVEQSARYATQVGFNFIAEAPRLALKQRLVAGEFGNVRRAGFSGFWPRNTSYFSRAPWAGKLMMGEQLILDSCTGNAMAHYIHNLLFWCGQGEVLSWGEVQEVEAELYRAHAIESFDTCFARGRCAGDIEIVVAATHAGSGESWQREWIECEQATIKCNAQQEYSIRWRDGREERGEADRRDLLVENLRHYARYVRGGETRPLTRLEDSRPFVHFNNLLFVAAGQIATIPETHLRRATARGREWIEIEGVEEMMEEFAEGARLPGERGLDWGQVGGRARIADLTQLEPVVQGMRDCRPKTSF
jgi:predicted dehydrogenase